MPFLEQKDVRIYYEDHGEGVPIVLTYGLAGNTRMWQPQIEDFSRRYRLVLWDQRGHGQSDSPVDSESYGVWKSVEDLHALIEVLGIEEAFIGGQSMGGGVATRFALRYPDETKALLVFNSHNASGLNSKPSKREMRKRSIEIVQNEGMEAMAEFSMQADANTMSHLECSPDSLDVARERIRQMFLASDPIGYVNSIVAARNSDDISGQLRGIQIPTLLVVGDKDPALDSMRFIRRKITHAVFEVLSNAGHHANLDNPRDFNATVLRFLDSQI